jgi:hypothetical protein
VQLDAVEQGGQAELECLVAAEGGGEFGGYCGHGGESVCGYRVVALAGGLPHFWACFGCGECGGAEGEHKQCLEGRYRVLCCAKTLCIV